ncbi:uncharacterized protein ACLA_043790 [Aspergillus clavatus NRRL 1]|uniref:Uncharacterized protein n=1 Tax=Aspergillus clavatus (strain ATCC 1007 / CBS 513.65 / DSM 816 / NCTC 3887 / NRRL 1 / QM 1276 / 107) TaxID=344612 RepID=A1C8M2_ASPCL|nr:uncharacterized protein ACLA_043790 [Aspergillus clavatus NRRL 1]EAW13659.1 hypothetical protein ACLA_043790 [Aspergillus clavatus NRRL 1]
MARRFEDETSALAEQLAEIDRYPQNDKGRHREDVPLDHNKATALFQEEEKAMIDYVAGLMLSSMRLAEMPADSPTIDDIGRGE